MGNVPPGMLGRDTQYCAQVRGGRQSHPGVACLRVWTSRSYAHHAESTGKQAFRRQGAREVHSRPKIHFLSWEGA
ncbi:hypothetical protein Y1Q_0003130 [Alligator mississippiensis]|uniref:Uncharacterized protein n=1 Tax=Alligator mississippiensis TaxID=8496 RepID=A0A151MDN9_ALLMI|nr:hypothetical protein Y1Q_0003130 [Alligator mississippiensis]